MVHPIDIYILINMINNTILPMFVVTIVHGDNIKS